MENEKLKMWFKRVGIAGFFFFLIKGLIWVYVFVSLGKCAMH
jgi:hypothetical protein